MLQGGQTCGRALTLDVVVGPLDQVEHARVEVHELDLPLGLLLLAQAHGREHLAVEVAGVHTVDHLERAGLGRAEGHLR